MTPPSTAARTAPHACLRVKAMTCCAAALVLTSCGPYRVRFIDSAHEPGGNVLKKAHSHGIGLIGGGGFFFALHQMFPAHVDYSGPVQVEAYCPDGFAEVSHHHDFLQNFAAGAISWILVLNVFHPSTVELTPAQAPPEPARAAPASPAPRGSRRPTRARS